MSKLKIIFVFVFIVIAIPTIPQLFHKNVGESISLGSVSKGSIEKSYLLRKKDNNYKYFSCFSYYFLGRAYVNSRVYNTIQDTYNELFRLHPDRKYIIMECSERKGGRMRPHITHQNGLSVDFMTPLVKKNKKSKYYNFLGLFRYALNFTNNGKCTLNEDVAIDFDAMAEHILLLEKYANQNGLRIKKVIFKIELKDELFSSESGKKLKSKNIYFVNKLSSQLNRLHDDHYHIDFELL